MRDMSEIRNQVQNLTGAAITPQQLSTIGGKVFANAQDSQGDFDRLVKFWMSIHAPTFGVAIPGTGTNKTGSGDGAILTPGTNETAHVVALSLVNGNGANPATVTLDVNGAKVAIVIIDPNGSAVAVGAGAQAMPSLDLAQGHILSMSVDGVSASAVSFAIAYSNLIQG